ncbi:MAG: endonuclease/exonuclease/phosphatase family protein [Sulfurisoma sp.]|nr:endonuclease/exonuclease/phosphatase family protein [Sulfurisoma sp.]
MRILSWNIQWGRGIDGRVDLARAAAVIRRCNADVVCLQEVAVNHPGLPGGAGGDQPARLAELLPGHETVYGAGSDLVGDMGGGRRLFGQMILVRPPVPQVFRHLLPWPPDPAVPSMQRVAVEAVVAAPEFPGGALRVITTHLEYYSAVLPRGEGCVLCGDFNSPAGAPEHEALKKVGAGGTPALVNAWPLIHGAVPPAPTFCVHDRGYLKEAACYDFFFVSANIADRVAALSVDGACTASDHQPVLIELRG